MTSRQDRAGRPAREPERSVRDQRAADGLDHLQAAALELIEAARAFLDVAEDVIADRDRVADVVATVSSIADAAASAAVGAPLRGGRRRSGAPGAGAGAADGPEPAVRRPRPGTGVEHIEVS